MSPRLKPLARPRASDDARHLMRYMRFKAGTSPADLAKSENVNVKAIMESIHRMEAFETKNSEGQLYLTLRSIAIGAAPRVAETLDGLLNAMTTYQKNNSKTGEIIYEKEPDKVTRLEALRVYKGLAETTIPKGPAVALQVNQTNAPVMNIGKSETVEERLRRLKAKAAEHNLLPPVTTGTPEYIDMGQDPMDDDDDDEEDE